jgi:PPOX class probable F420-dependent enzyme
MYHGLMITTGSVLPAPLVLPAPVRAFLEAPNVASVATVDDDGTPRQAVAWYRLEPDGRILLNSRTPRRWCTNLSRDPRVSLSVIDAADPYRWLGITGVVDEVVADDVERARDDIVALAHRYHPEGPTESSIAAFRTQPRVTFLVRITGIHDHLED